MKSLTALIAALAIVAIGVSGCATNHEGWVTLIDGERGLENFNRIGDANWRAEKGAIVADKGKGGHLVSKNSYKDFIIRAEFYAETNTNSGIFVRASNPKQVGSANAYEVNIWDIRPDPTYATGAIVGLASVPVPIIYKAGGRWNTMEIHAQGPEITVTFNGTVSSYVRDGKFPSGPFTLQYGAGVKGAVGGAIKWRHVSIKPL